MNNIQTATKTQSLTRGHSESKSIKQQNNSAKKQSAHKVDKAKQSLDEHKLKVHLTKLPEDAFNEVCSFLTLKDRLSLTETSKRYSPLEKSTIQTQSLGTEALKQLAKKEATKWINQQLQCVNKDPNQLIRKICMGEIIIPMRH